QFKTDQAIAVTSSTANQIRVTSPTDAWLDAHSELTSSTEPSAAINAANVSAALTKLRPSNERIPALIGRRSAAGISSSSIRDRTVTARPSAAKMIHANTSARD